jgi:hypothetical protein
MTQFHEGQEVEIKIEHMWPKKARVTHVFVTGGAAGNYQVEFADGTRAIFDAEHIRFANRQDAKANEQAEELRGIRHY